MHTISKTLSSLSLFLLLAAGAQAAEWATLTGRIVVYGKPPKAETIQATKDVEVCGKHKLLNEGLLAFIEWGIQTQEKE